MHDPIVEEVRQNRDKLAAKYNYDIDAIATASRKRQENCGHKIVDLSKKKMTA